MGHRTTVRTLKAKKRGANPLESPFAPLSVDHLELCSRRLSRRPEYRTSGYSCAQAVENSVEAVVDKATKGSHNILGSRVMVAP